MPRGKPQNLIPQAHKLTVEEQSMGGKKSAEVRKAKKTIKKILEDYLESDCKDNPLLKKLAEKIGVDGTESVKTLFTMTCVLNTMKSGDVRSLGMMKELLDEDGGNDLRSETEDDPLTAALREEAERMNDANQ